MLNVASEKRSVEKNSEEANETEHSKETWLQIECCANTQNRLALETNVTHHLWRSRKIVRIRAYNESVLCTHLSCCDVWFDFISPGIARFSSLASSLPSFMFFDLMAHTSALRFSSPSVLSPSLLLLIHPSPTRTCSSLSIHLPPLPPSHPVTPNLHAPTPKMELWRNARPTVSARHQTKNRQPEKIKEYIASEKQRRWRNQKSTSTKLGIAVHCLLQSSARKKKNHLTGSSKFHEKFTVDGLKSLLAIQPTHVKNCSFDLSIAKLCATFYMKHRTLIVHFFPIHLFSSFSSPLSLAPSLSWMLPSTSTPPVKKAPSIMSTFVSLLGSVPWLKMAAGLDCATFKIDFVTAVLRTKKRREQQTASDSCAHWVPSHGRVLCHPLYTGDCPWYSWKKIVLHVCLSVPLSCGHLYAGSQVVELSPAVPNPKCILPSPPPWSHSLCALQSCCYAVWPRSLPAAPRVPPPVGDKIQRCRIRFRCFRVLVVCRPHWRFLRLGSLLFLVWDLAVVVLARHHVVAVLPRTQPTARRVIPLVEDCVPSCRTRCRRFAIQRHRLPYLAVCFSVQSCGSLRFHLLVLAAFVGSSNTVGLRVVTFSVLVCVLFLLCVCLCSRDNLQNGSLVFEETTNFIPAETK